MAKRSASAVARSDEKRQAIQSELDKYRGLVQALRTSAESTLSKTHKQKEYHKKILELQHQLDGHGR